jgi:hypothetical protein
MIQDVYLGLPDLGSRIWDPRVRKALYPETRVRNTATYRMFRAFIKITIIVPSTYPIGIFQIL